jgi:hypothetical protein
MANPIEWKEADRTETKTIPGASARLVVRRRYAPRGIIETTDATPADLASALDAVSEADREAIVKATGIVEALFEQLDAVRKQREQICYESSGRLVERNAARAERDAARTERDAARTERDDAREELRAREWLDAKGCASRPVFVRDDGGPFVYASYAGAARALGWEG